MKKNVLFYLLISTLVIGCNRKANNSESINSNSEIASSAETEQSIEQSVDNSQENKSEEALSEVASSEAQSISEVEESSIYEEFSSQEEISSEEEVSSEQSSTSEETSSQVDNSIWTSDVGNYYADLDLTLSGDELLSNLQAINKAKRKSTVGYNAMLKSTASSSKFLYTDYDPNNKSKVIAFYRESSESPSTNVMNREHVWPKSHGGNLVENDIHMPRPTLNSDNSDRGNSFYVEGKVDKTYGWDPYAAGMTEKYRGICARIIFYCCVAAYRKKSPMFSIRLME